MSLSSKVFSRLYQENPSFNECISGSNVIEFLETVFGEEAQSEAIKMMKDFSKKHRGRKPRIGGAGIEHILGCLCVALR
jgi:hypothetical protein